MTDLRKRVEETLARLKNQEDLTPEDYALLIPATEKVRDRLEDPRAASEHQFKHGFGGYVIDGVFVKESVGLRYLSQLLQAESFSCVKSIECLDLTAGPVIPLEALDAETRSKSQRAVLAYEDDYEEIDYASSNVTNARGVFDQRDPQMDEQYTLDIQRKIEALKKTDGDKGELEFLEGFLKQNTFKGKAKCYENQRDDARRAVRKAIREAVTRLSANPDTQHIGLHFDRHIKYGHSISYEGNWRWKF